MAPMHALIFLSSSNNKVIRLFSMSTTDKKAMPTSVAKVRDKVIASVEIVDKFIELVEISGFRAIVFEESHGILDLATP